MREQLILKKFILLHLEDLFFNRELDTFAQIKLSDALQHPTWKHMGAKVTIDSSTMMNKGLEIIEAYFLFGRNADKISVVVHPESIVHSFVEYIDGSFLGQFGLPDMRVVISYGLGYPIRLSSGVAGLDFSSLMQLSFMPPDLHKFPCLKLAFDILKSEDLNAAAVMNISNDIAVEFFLQEKIQFLDIYNIVEFGVNHFAVEKCNCLDDRIALSHKLNTDLGAYIERKFVC